MKECHRARCGFLLAVEDILIGTAVGGIELGFGWLGSKPKEEGSKAAAIAGTASGFTGIDLVEPASCASAAANGPLYSRTADPIGSVQALSVSA